MTALAVVPGNHPKENTVSEPYNYDLDRLPRARLRETELGDMPGDLADVLDDWLAREHGVLSSNHGVGSFLDELAAKGYRVTRIDPGPPGDPHARPDTHPKEPEVIERPNGKPYRPRKPGLRARSWDNQEDGCGVIVFGTLDPDRAHAFAVEMCRHWHHLPVAVDPQPGWYREAFVYGERRWIEDEQRGAPGVMFTAEDAPLGAQP